MLCSLPHQNGTVVLKPDSSRSGRYSTKNLCASTVVNSISEGVDSSRESSSFGYNIAARSSSFKNNSGKRSSLPPSLPDSPQTSTAETSLEASSADCNANVNVQVSLPSIGSCSSKSNRQDRSSPTSQSRPSQRRESVKRLNNLSGLPITEFCSCKSADNHATCASPDGSHSSTASTKLSSMRMSRINPFVMSSIADSRSALPSIEVDLAMAGIARSNKANRSTTSSSCNHGVHFAVKCFRSTCKSVGINR